MEPQQLTAQPPQPPVSPTPSPSPSSSVKGSLLVIVSLLLLIAVGLAGFFYWQMQRLSKELAQYQTQPAPAPTPSPTVEDEILALQITTCCSCPTKISRSLIGTDGWVIYERGKNYSNLLPEECNRVDCQPCPPLEEENQTKIDCKDPRPEVCTMECIQNPPYICGSDGKSYCTICQACSNRGVTWYEMRVSPCGEGQFSVPTISDSDLSRGWYWGTKDQKKPNTPASWIYTEAGRSSCWHKPNVLCR